ncbi:MAG: hypothetical protein WDA65_06735 [Christensenellales bacterium]
MRKFINIFIKVSLVVYIAFIIYAMFIKSRGHWSDMPLKDYLLFQSNFIPFKTIIFYINSIFDGSIKPRYTCIKYKRQPFDVSAGGYIFALLCETD